MASVDSFHLLYNEIARSCSPYFETLALIGALYTAGKTIALLRDCCSLIRVHFLPRIIPRKNLTHRFGKWAVIYGESATVAIAYAEELAKHGVSIIFISQDHSYIGDFVTSLSQSYGVESVVIFADFTMGHEASKPITDALRGKDVGFLVNCMDECLAFSQNLIEMSEQRLLDLVNKNVVAATLMTRLVLPGMLERSRGAVVNISSGASCQPWPGRVALTASTAYLDNLSRALRLEYGCKGIFVQSLIPLKVASSGQPSSAKGGWLVPKPEVYARHAISTLGIAHRTTGYWPHTLQYGLMRSIPEWIWELCSYILIRSS